MESQGSVQRTFRLTRSTSDLLDQVARHSTESRNSIADRVLGEGLRTEAHPAIRFRSGAAGRREPALAGTRLLVRQVVATFTSSGRDVNETATYLSISPALVRAALSYYADYRAEIDADQAWADAVEDAERQRWEREQALLA
ncbi:MAG: hypothetical protein QM733_08795 [Ilumatobacteraceae bacterium]